MEMSEGKAEGAVRTPITHSLRERLKVTAVMLGHEPSTPLTKGVLAECDNIDAIHKALEDENAELRETVFEHEISNVETTTFLDRLSDAADKREDVTLWGVRYKALPLGADGSSLGIGDKVDSDVYVGGTVTAVRWDETPNGIRALIAVRPNGWDTSTWYDPGDFRRHHHIEPTVEDVLRKFTRAILNQKPEYREQNIAKYAKRLQLANREPLEEVGDE